MGTMWATKKKNVMNFYLKEVHGGIAAAFDEIPCIKTLLSKYCSKYTMVQSISKTDGFGFVSSLSLMHVFPKGSHFISDVSRAILNVTKGEKMKEIAKTWLGDQSDCPSSNTQVSSGGLSLESFLGPIPHCRHCFLISSRNLLFHKIWIHFDSKNSIWRRIRHALRIFDNKDLSSHTFRNRALTERGNIDCDHCIGAGDASPSTNCLTSPIRYSVHMEPEFTLSEDSGTTSRECFIPNPHGHQQKLMSKLAPKSKSRGSKAQEIAVENC
ncbi:glutamate receptor 2.8 [Quercus suber]|uniref:Glutamate receptor 2.8 n=1 Tax=Quercus suber TaxID=58331 RepID=A0AAW0JR10_QUESU